MDYTRGDLSMDFFPIYIPILIINAISVIIEIVLIYHQETYIFFMSLEITFYHL